jgi:outer membrane protein assembly factor BamB
MTLRLPDLLTPDAWFLTAFDARTGRQVWSRHVGSGLGHNNNYAPVTLGADGTAYVGTLGGLVRIADG